MPLLIIMIIRFSKHGDQGADAAYRIHFEKKFGEGGKEKAASATETGEAIRYLGNASKRRRVHVNKSRSLTSATCRGSASAVEMSKDCLARVRLSSGMHQAS